MTDDFEKSKLCIENEVPEQYRPLSCTKLTKKQVEYARKYRNETEETLNNSIPRLRKFLEDELDEFSELDDNFLLAFLRGCKFNFEETCWFVKNTADFLQKNRSYFNRIDTEILSRVIQSNAMGFLPYRDAKGRALAIIIAENWDPDVCSSEEMVFGMILTFYTRIENPVNQVSGLVAILDFKNVSFRQFQEIIGWVLFVVNFLKDSYPRVIKEIHVIHTPSIVLFGWNMVKPILSEPTLKIITFYDSSNWESLHDKIPPCILPEEIGGQLGPFSNIHWASDVRMIRKRFFDMFGEILSEPEI